MLRKLTPIRGALLAALAACALLSFEGMARPRAGSGGTDIEVTVIIENLAPDNGTYLTPVWVGFHDGSFDLHDLGAPASMELERLAEDGNTVPLSDLFPASGAQATLVSDTGIPPLAPGETATMTFTLDPHAANNRYFSYATMVIPSNDAFIANDDPQAHRIFSSKGGFRGADFIVGGVMVNDAGTELNDENPANTAFFGQMTPDTGQDESVVVHDHVGFKLPGSGGILDDLMFGNADFMVPGYQVARVTILSGPPGDDDDDDDDDDDED
jgi:hypothetical protein